MKKILFVGDLHFKKTNTEKTDKILEFILSLDKSKYAFIVLLGDILHTHDKIDMWCHIRATNFITSISKNFKVFVIIGNHDRPNNKVFCEKGVNAFSNITSSEQVEETNNINIIDYPTVFEYKNNKICFVPYVEDNRFNEAVNLVLKEDEKDDYIFFAHQNFKGSDFDYDCTEAFTGKLCISGHIHDEKWVNKNLFYTEEKGVYELSFSPRYKIKNLFKFDKEEKIIKKTKEEITEIIQEKIEKLNFLDLIKIQLKKDKKDELFKFF